MSKYNQTWWYRSTNADGTRNSAFASDYAKTHPLDDFAETIAAYFLQKAGLPWYQSTDGSGASAIAQKTRLLDWL